MAVYTHLPTETIEQIAQSYHLGTVLKAQEIAEGVENSNYLLHTQKENGTPEKHILTVYEKRVDTSDLPFFLGLMEHLASQDIPCPVPLHTFDGAPYLTLKEHGNKTASIVTFLQGKSTSIIHNHHVAELGSYLAKMHVSSQSFTGHRHNDMALEGWEALQAEIHEAEHNLSPRMLEVVEAEYTYLKAHWPKDLPDGIIHADLFPDNVFFKDEHLSGLIDFYFACHDFFLYDVAITLNAWCFENKDEFNITKAGILLRHYHQHRPISAAELEALPILCRGAALRFLLTRLADSLTIDEGAIVTLKNPEEYLGKLQFHQRVKSAAEYGIYR